MDSNPTCLVHHIGSLPVPAALFSQAAIYYKWARQYRLANFTFGLAEESLQIAYDTAKPVRNLLDKPICVASGYAVRKLEGFEQNYPAIKMSPQEILAEAKRYVETSRIHRGVEAIRSAKGYGEKKVADTKDFCTGVVGGVVQTGQQSAAKAIRTGMAAVNGVIDLSEDFVDHYVVPGGKVADVHDNQDGSALDRVANIYGKFSFGLKERATTSAQLTYEMALASLNQIRSTRLMLENFNHLTVWAKDHSGAAVTQAQQTLMDLINSVSSGVKTAGQNPFTIDFVRFFTGGSELAMTRLLAVSHSFLPDSMMKPLMLASTYVHSINQTATEAESLTDLKAELMAQMREKCAEVEDVVSRVVDLAASFPAKITVKINSDSEEKATPIRLESSDSQQSDESNLSVEEEPLSP